MKTTNSTNTNIPELKNNKDDRVPCQFCDRKFAADRIDKHEKTCNSQKERPKFDTSK